MLFRSSRARIAIAIASLTLLGLPAIADAAGEKDAEAMKLHDQAMDEDYLAVEFDKAEKKLKDALKKCGKDGCTEKVLGKLHIALGTVYGGAGKLDEAKTEFVAALKADPKAALIDALTTPELAKAYKDAQKEAGSGAPKPATPEGDGGDDPTAAKKPEGDISHTPIAEQAINTPVPVYIEIPEEVGATKVGIRYKPFGSKKWKSAEMQQVGDGWGVEIPCEDVTTTGDLRYYIIAKDDAGDPVGTAGSLKVPYKVSIKNEIDEAPSLPGRKPPQKCAAKEDCPPGLPGCPSGKGDGGSRGDKSWGSSCEETQECSSGLICLNGTCEEGTETPTEKKSTGKKNLIGVWGQLDLLLISGKEQGVCSGDDPSYVCFYSNNDAQFYGQPADVAGTNGIQGGLGVAGVRALLSYDRHLLQITPKVALTAGLRVGYAFGGSPGSEVAPRAWEGGTEDAPGQNPHAQANPYLPLHAELRIGAMFGDGTLAKRKFIPFAFVGGGLAQVNASVNVSVCDYRDTEGQLVGGGGEGTCPAGTRAVRDLNAYQITGLNFIGLGGGAIYGITDNIGVAAELKFMFMVPTFGVVIAPQLGPVFAF
ncbi:tetratricopeptide repeat protein [Chondromyces apiculatus]|uniref:Uncharacterized protein n=1 Tax=Chondromyces apiculatus DSM 436 TaxID=1192034 RepID=A0A017TEU5_9BACT|nr:hypothetical protein [Chondromyces apiculatus]EYF07350.1 Hypothetical protein CAP_0103 [Chondromyces apiculatus DSM 436]